MKVSCKASVFSAVYGVILMCACEPSPSVLIDNGASALDGDRYAGDFSLEKRDETCDAKPDDTTNTISQDGCWAVADELIQGCSAEEMSAFLAILNARLSTFEVFSLHKQGILNRRLALSLRGQASVLARYLENQGRRGLVQPFLRGSTLSVVSAKEVKGHYYARANVVEVTPEGKATFATKVNDLECVGFSRDELDAQLDDSFYRLFYWIVEFLRVRCEGI